MTKTTPNRSEAISRARDLVAHGRFATDLAELIACRTESQRPDQTDAMQGYLRKQLQPRLTALGFECGEHHADGATFLIAKRIEDPDAPTVLMYGHGDVTHGQYAAWADGLDPFKLTQRGQSLYGRGAADNKGQHLINLLALEMVLTARGGLGVNVTWLFEMGEEVGSPGLETLCRENAHALKADVLIASDGPRLRHDWPTVFLGARGAVNFDLSVNLREGAHHSGNWGGLLADPAMILAQALSCITDARGALKIDAWRPTSLTKDIRADLAVLPEPGGKGPSTDPNWGEPGLTAAEKLYGWNSFAVLAMSAGVPEAPVNAICGQAKATCQLRFVVGTNPEAILPSLRAHLDAAGFDQVQISEDGTYFPATRSNAYSAWVRRVTTSIATTMGQGPDILPNLAGSLPNHCFSEILGVPTVWVPHSYAGCNQHAPDEHMLLEVAEQGLAVMTGIFWDLAQSAIAHDI
ncbi:MAG: M20 family metallopeptidase [Aliishimia sp.]